MSYKLPPALRRQVLNEEPRCRRCGEPAAEVDHIMSRASLRAMGLPEDLVRELGDRRDNLQALCVPCHAAKTEQEFPGARERYGKARAARKSALCAPVEPDGICDMCGGPMFFGDPPLYIDLACQECQGDVSADGGYVDSYVLSRIDD